jgi:hypothetical protein
MIMDRDSKSTVTKQPFLAAEDLEADSLPHMRIFSFEGHHALALCVAGCFKAKSYLHTIPIIGTIIVAFMTHFPANYWIEYYDARARLNQLEVGGVKYKWEVGACQFAWRRAVLGYKLTFHKWWWRIVQLLGWLIIQIVAHLVLLFGIIKLLLWCCCSGDSEGKQKVQKEKGKEAMRSQNARNQAQPDKQNWVVSECLPTIFNLVPLDYDWMEWMHFYRWVDSHIRRADEIAPSADPDVNQDRFVVMATLPHPAADTWINRSTHETYGPVNGNKAVYRKGLCAWQKKVYQLSQMRIDGTGLKFTTTTKQDLAKKCCESAPDYSARLDALVVETDELPGVISIEPMPGLFRSLIIDRQVCTDGEARLPSNGGGLGIARVPCHVEWAYTTNHDSSFCTCNSSCDCMCCGWDCYAGREADIARVPLAQLEHFFFAKRYTSKRRGDLGPYVKDADKWFDLEDVNWHYSKLSEKRTTTFNQLRQTIKNQILAYAKVHEIPPEWGDVGKTKWTDFCLGRPE